MEPGFKERLDDLLYGTCDYTVFYGWHPKGSELPRLAALGYPHPSGGRWCIGTILQFLSHSLKICVYTLLVDMLDGDPVDSWCSPALVCGNSQPGAPEVAGIDNPTPQLTVSPFRVLLTPLIEFSLHAE